MSFQGQVVVVTGGGRGIGRAIARAFAQEGAKVVICSRTRAELDSAAEEIDELGAEVLSCETDVSDPDDVAELVDRTIERFGGVDILVNNAGVWIPGSAEDYPLSDLQTTMDVNVHGVFLCSQAVFDSMADDGGVIVNVSSVRGLEGYPRMAAYSASKFAVNGLTEALAREWQSHDIRVNAVCPGPVGTGFADGEPRDRSRILPEDVADATLFLASEDAEHVTAETLVVSKQDFEYERYD
jgi:3-oxoacyl-[acyl-carrier protein] reductase